jgi:hypothetical protein
MSAEEQRFMDVLKMLRPEMREVVLAFGDLLPEDQEELGRPIIERAAHMRKYLDVALARHGVSHSPGNTRGNNLPMAPRAAKANLPPAGSSTEPAQLNNSVTKKMTARKGNDS